MAKVTSKDVAQLAGVSQAAVSYVLNDTPGKSISPETRERILSAAKQLNYVPNIAAQRLKTHRSNCIAVRLATTLSIARYYLALQGIRSCLEPQGYNIILFNDKKTRNSRNYLDACMNTQADGILYISANYNDVPDDIMAVIRREQIPLSVIDCMGSISDVCSINYDYYAATYLRAEYMIKKGIRQIVYAGPSARTVKNLAREQGVRNCIENHPGVSLQIRNYEAEHDGSSAEYDAIPGVRKASQYGMEPAFYQELIRTLPAGAGILCSYPEDQQYVTVLLSMTANAPIPGCDFHWYDRSVSYEYDHYAIGFEAARSLLEQINGNRNVRKLTLQPRIIPTEPAYFTLQQTGLCN